MAVQVKICGLTRPEDADAVLRAGADFAGLVFHPGSPRHLRPGQAAAIARALRAKVRVVALLADPTDAELSDAVAAADPDWIQLHGRESPARVAHVRSRFGRPVIKTLAIAEDADFAPLDSYHAVADMLLFDAKPPAGAERAGGHGRAFDWQLLRGRTIRKPWLLAGGLHAGNVGRARAASGAQGVDVSSGVESPAGVKDAEAIAAFAIAARAADVPQEVPA